MNKTKVQKLINHLRDSSALDSAFKSVELEMRKVVEKIKNDSETQDLRRSKEMAKKLRSELSEAIQSLTESFSVLKVQTQQLQNQHRSEIIAKLEELEQTFEEAQASSTNGFEEVSLSLTDIQREIAVLEEKVQLPDFASQISRLETKLTSLFRTLKDSYDETFDEQAKDFQKKLEELDLDLRQLRAGVLARGGNAQRRIDINSSIMSTRFSDIDFVNNATIGWSVSDVNGRARITASVLSASGGSPAGANTQIQYNDSGAFGGSSTLTWNKNTSVFSATNINIPSFTQGSIPFQLSTSVLGENNANLFWDNTNTRLSIGTSSQLGAKINVISSVAGDADLIIRQVASQTGRPLEVQLSNGTPFAYIDPNQGYFVYAKNGTFPILVNDTANGTWIFRIGPTGDAEAAGTYSTATGIRVTAFGAYVGVLNNQRFVFNNNGIDAYGGNTGDIVLRVNALASQTGDLTRWLNSSAAVLALVNKDGGFTFNEQGADTDCRVEGDTDANLIYTDASTDRVGIGTATPATKLDVIGTVGMSDKITNYSSVLTAGWGVPAIYGTGRSTAQTAAVATVATYTVGAADGSFIVSSNVNVTTSTAHNFTVTCAYTDETNTARTLTLTFSQLAGTLVTAITNVTGAGPYEGIPLHIRAKASTAITIATTGTFTTVTYNVEGTITQIS